jgi:hypothetical protein
MVMSLNSIFNAAAVAAGADGIPLDRFGAAAARELLLLFALVALGQLALALVALAALVRYRSLVPLVWLLLIGEQAARRLLVAAQAGERTASAAPLIGYGLLALMILGLLLSLLPRPAGRR